MAKYSIDTNVYIDSFREPSAADELKEFLLKHLPVTYLSAIVMQELRLGARSKEQVKALEEGLFSPFERRRRVFTPSSNAFKTSGRILAEFGVGYMNRTASRGSFANDTLLAASCLEQGMTLITKDSDFSRIKQKLGAFRHAVPWP